MGSVAATHPQEQEDSVSQCPFFNAAATKPPGSTGWPIIGDTLGVLTNLTDLQKKKASLGPIAQTNVFFHDAYIVFGPKAVEQFYDEKNCKRHESNLPKAKRHLLLHGLEVVPNMDGQPHIERKAFLLHAFTEEAINGYLDVFKTHSDDLVTYLKDKVDKEVKLTPIFLPFISIAMIEVVCGPQEKSATFFSEEMSKFIAGMKSLMIAQYIPGSSLNKGEEAREHLLGVFEQSLANHRNLSAPSKTDIMARLLEAQKSTGYELTDSEFLGEFLHFAFAGSGGIPLAVNIVLYILGKHQEIKDKLVRQLKAHEDVFQIPSVKAMQNKVPYLLQVVKESLRMYPIIPMQFAKAATDFELFGFSIKKDEFLIAGITGTHYDPSVYTNPDVFDPDRFSSERNEGAGDYSYIPFGGSIPERRKCAGSQLAPLLISIVIAKLLLAFDIQIDPKLGIKESFPPAPNDDLPAILSLRQ